MPDQEQPDDRKVKEVLDSATRADLERWFGLPSFEVAAERAAEAAPVEEDPELAQRRKRQEDAMAAVDPALLEAIRLRSDPGQLLEPLPPLTIHVDPSISQLDEAMVEQRYTIAEPRELELPHQLYDDLHERVPQALLRDLHRPERHYEKRLERVDLMEEYRIDIAASTSQVMAASMKPSFGRTPMAEALDLLRELRRERTRPWIEIEMPNRRVTQ